jgi:hypothetical protein
MSVGNVAGTRSALRRLFAMAGIALSLGCFPPTAAPRADAGAVARALETSLSAIELLRKIGDFQGAANQKGLYERLLESLPPGDPQRHAFEERLWSIEAHYSEAWFAKTDESARATAGAFDALASKARRGEPFDDEEKKVLAALATLREARPDHPYLKVVPGWIETAKLWRADVAEHHLVDVEEPGLGFSIALPREAKPFDEDDLSRHYRIDLGKDHEVEVHVTELATAVFLTREGTIRFATATGTKELTEPGDTQVRIPGVIDPDVRASTLDGHLVMKAADAGDQRKVGLGLYRLYASCIGSEKDTKLLVAMCRSLRLTKNIE